MTQGLRVHTPLLIATLIGLSLAATAGITWSTQTNVQAHATDPPLVFEAGDNADNPRWFKSFEISDDNTSFTAEIIPRAGAGAHVEDVVRLTNDNAQQRYVTLEGTPIDNEHIPTFEWTLTDDDETVTTLDHTQPDPSTTFTLPPNETVTFAITVQTEPGAGKHNAGISFTLSLEVT